MLFRVEDLADGDQAEPGYIQRGLAPQALKHWVEDGAFAGATPSFRAVTKSQRDALGLLASLASTHQPPTGFPSREIDFQQFNGLPSLNRPSCAPAELLIIRRSTRTRACAREKIRPQ